MIFEKNYTTKWHDTDASRRVRITKLLEYMQETSNAHMDAFGPSLDRLRDEHRLAFILSKTRIKIYQPVFAYEDIQVRTWTSEPHGFAIPRAYEILKDGIKVAEANTVWALIDIDTRRLVKGNDGMSHYGFKNLPPLSTDVPNRFKLPSDTELVTVARRRIVYSDLDYNMHMNNTKYTDMLCDFIPYEDIGRISGVLLSYVNEAAFGDTLEVNHTFADRTHYFRTVDQNGKICLEAQLILKDENRS